MTGAEIDTYIERAEELLRGMRHHTGGTLRVDAFHVSDTMLELVRRIDAA